MFLWYTTNLRRRLDHAFTAHILQAHAIVRSDCIYFEKYHWWKLFTTKSEKINLLHSSIFHGKINKKVVGLWHSYNCSQHPNIVRICEWLRSQLSFEKIYISSGLLILICHLMKFHPSDHSYVVHNYIGNTWYEQSSVLKPRSIITSAKLFKDNCAKKRAKFIGYSSWNYWHERVFQKNVLKLIFFTTAVNLIYLNLTFPTESLSFKISASFGQTFRKIS